MPLHVQREVVRAGKGSFTQVALEWPVAGVLPVVTSQLVGPCKLPSTALPVAMVWFFTCRQGKINIKCCAQIILKQASKLIKLKRMQG